MRRLRNRQPMSRLWTEKGGVAAVEFALIAPLLITLLFGTLTLFTAWREVQRNEKATYTITDIVSRYYEIGTSDLVQINEIFDHAVSNKNSPVRITSVVMGGSKLTVQWSYAVKPFKMMTNTEIPISQLPVISPGDSLIITETKSPRIPLTPFGMVKLGTIDSIATARPRFVSAITKTN